MAATFGQLPAIFRFLGALVMIWVTENDSDFEVVWYTSIYKLKFCQHSRKKMGKDFFKYFWSNIESI